MCPVVAGTARHASRFNAKRGFEEKPTPVDSPSPYVTVGL
jgi:hypothetical protein